MLPIESSTGPSRPGTSSKEKVPEIGFMKMSNDKQTILERNKSFVKTKETDAIFEEYWNSFNKTYQTIIDEMAVIW